MTTALAVQEAPTEIQTAAVPTDLSAGAMIAAMGGNDLSRLNDTDKLKFLANVAASCRLNPWTQPFGIYNIKGKVVLYAKKDCTDQLRLRDKITIKIIGRSQADGCYMVTARATTPDLREDESVGVVAIFPNMGGEDRANAMMKAETKAKRRVTLSICGLGFPDESELETINADRRESGLTEMATANDKAAALNADLETPLIPAAFAEPEELPAAATAPVAVSPVPDEVIPPAAPSPPAPAATPSASASSTLTADQIEKLEPIMGPIFKDAVAWLESNPYKNGALRLVKGAAWETVDLKTAQLILSRPDDFTRRVKEWSVGRKGQP